MEFVITKLVMRGRLCDEIHLATVKNSTKAEMELVLRRVVLLVLRGRDCVRFPREEVRRGERERKMMTTANILCEKISTKRLRGLRLALNQFGST